jgi:hypothetical protein
LEKYQGTIGGFTTANYGTLPNRFQTAVANGETWEVVGAFMTSSFASGQMLFTDGAASGQAGYTGFVVEILPSGRLEVGFDWSTASQAQGVVGSTPIQLNTKYWYKVTFDGSKYQAFISTNGIDWDSFFNYASAASIVSSGNATYLGIVNRGGLIYPATYTNIYLNDSYVKINGDDWWTGTLDGTSSDYDYSIGDNDGNYCILKDYSSGKLSLTDGIYISKTKDKPWTQPILNANGTMGGDSFAVAANFERSSHYAWYAMDGVTTGNTGWFSDEIATAGVWYSFYNPIPLNVTNLEFLNYTGANYVTTSGRVQISNDGQTWTDIKSYTNSTVAANASWSIDLSDNTYFAKYYRIYSDSNVGTAGWIIRELTITATEQVNNRLDISTVPANLYLGGILNNNLVYIGDCTILGGVITKLKNNKFNMNGYWELCNLPDYNAGISKPSSGFTADEDGWLYILARSKGYAVTVHKNGIEIYGTNQAGSTAVTTTDTDFVPVYRGDVITSVINTNGSLELTFYPMRGY